MSMNCLEHSPRLNPVLEDAVTSISPDRRFDQYTRGFVDNMVKLVAVASESSRSDVFTRFAFHKTADDQRTSNLPYLEPISINRAGFYIQGADPCCSELVERGVFHWHPSPRRGSNQPVLKLADKFRGEVTVRDSTAEDIRSFLTDADFNNFFQQHDEERIYPEVTDESAIIGVDLDHVDDIYQADGLVEDALYEELMHSREKTFWETEVKTPIKNVLVPLFEIAKRFKNIYTQKSDRIDGITGNTAYNRRKLNIGVFNDQYRPWMGGEVTLFNGYVDLNSTTADEMINGRWRLREHPHSDATIPVEFDGTYGPPSHRIYDIGLGVLGVALDGEDGPYVKAVAVRENGELPSGLIQAQTQALSRIQFEISQQMARRQLDIEHILQAALENGELSEADRHVALRALRTISDVDSATDVYQEIIKMEKTEQVLKLIIEGLQYIDSDVAGMF